MANFGYDQFNEAADTSLILHTADIGGGWANNLLTAVGTVQGGLGTMQGPGAGRWLMPDAVPGSADYNVKVDYIRNFSSQAFPEINIRITPQGTRHDYTLQHQSANNQLRILRWVNGTATELIAVAQAQPASGSTTEIKFAAVGNVLTGYWNNVAVITATDSTHTAAGRVGCGIGDSRFATFTAADGGGAPTDVTFAGQNINIPLTLAPSSGMLSAPGGAVTFNGQNINIPLTLAPSSGMLSNVGLNRFTTAPLKNKFGTVLANVSNITIVLLNPSTHAVVLRKTGLTSDNNGVVTFLDAAVVVSTIYAYWPDLTATNQGSRLPTAMGTVA